MGSVYLLTSGGGLVRRGISFHLLRSGQSNPGCQVSQGESDECSGESTDVCPGLTCYHLYELKLKDKDKEKEKTKTK